MRKLSLIIVAFTLVLFTQCKKEKITENTNPVGEDGRMVPITLELPVDNGAKTNFEDFLMNPSNPQGTITWREDGPETVYLAVPNKIIYDEDTGEEIASKEYAQMIPLTGTLVEGATSIKFSGTVDTRVLNENFGYTLYYFGNTGGSEVKELNGMGHEVTLGVTLSLNGQDGSRENLGNYHFATLEGIHVHITEYETLANGRKVAKSYAIHTNYPYFTTQVAIAYLDCNGIEQTTPYGINGAEEGKYLYGGNANCMLADEITVSFNETQNIYNVSYHISQDDNTIPYLGLSNQVEQEAFIVLAPGTTTIKADGKGTYTFEGGTQVNHVYYSKNIATNTISPLVWTVSE